MKLQPKDIFDRLIRRDVPRLDRAFFDSIPDEHLVTTVWKHIIDKKPEGQTELEFLSLLPEEAKHLLLIMILDGEVRNGGFNQYLFNTEGAYADETIKALQKMCGSKHAEPLQGAIKFLQEEATDKMGKTPESITEMLDTLGDEFDEIDFGNFDAEWERTDKARAMQMSRSLRNNAEIFLDSAHETKVSDELKEPTAFVAADNIKKECAAIASDNDKNSRLKKYTALFNAAREAGRTGEAEAVVREAMASMRWMPMAGVKDPLFLDILKLYKTLLDESGRDLQSTAVQWHLDQHQTAKTK